MRASTVIFLPKPLAGHGSRRFAVLLGMAMLAACAPTTPAPPPVAAPQPAPVIPVAPPRVTMPVLPPVALCGRGMIQPGVDGRLLNHFRYPDTPASILVGAPPPLGDRCRVHPAMLPDLTRLLAAAQADPAVAGSLRAVSCHRPEILQRQTFCGGIGPDGSAGFTDRAWASAPPGHSEHATGYVIDFGSSDSRACDAEACFGATPAARWLRANAARFGFEMSFPPGNRQQVKWEPWHWRWVGTSATTPGAATARSVFATARTRFPAEPAVQ